MTTTCTAPATGIVVASIFITASGQGYATPPVLSLTGAGGSMSSHTVTIESLVETITLLSGGKNYSSAPAVEFIGGTLTGAGEAIATVEGSITGVAVNNGGSGYTEPPEVTFATGTKASATAVMSGYVAALQITNPGTGYSFPPSVSFSGGGGSGAAATAEISLSSGSVIGLYIKTKGSDYTSAPAVTITGGGGKDAKATALLLYTVKSISVSDGGSGYPPSPGVTLTGGGGGGASATATISGSVVGITVTTPPKYRNTVTRPIAGPGESGWPVINLTGGGGSGATASPVFSGKVVAAAVTASGYTTAPAVVFSEGGGSGAAAIAELSWQQDHYRRIFVSPDQCIADFGEQTHCLNATASKLPPQASISLLYPQYTCPGVGPEQVSWSAGVVTNADNVVNPSYFPGEAIRATVKRWWRVPGDLLPITPGGGHIAQVINTEYRQRFYSRVQPNFVYRMATPVQAPDDNVSITPSFRQYADALGEPFWLLESLTITSPGQNLRIPPGTLTCDLVADGNSRHICRNRQITVARSAPIVEVPTLRGWSVQPNISVTVTPSGSGGLHVVSAVEIAAGGTTTQLDGTFTIDLALTAGHFLADNGRARLVGTIAGGTLSAISIETADPIIGPSTLATITLGVPNLNSPDFRVVGESPFKTSRVHSVPTVTASRTVGGITQNLGVTLAQATDLMGETYWYVSGLTGPPPAPGDAPVIFVVANPGVEASPAIVQVLTPPGDPAFYRIRSGGKYFVRTISETSQLLPPISCIGDLNQQNGWEIQMLEEMGIWTVFEVGESFGAVQEIPNFLGSYETARTRRCGLPTITLELE